MKYSESQHVFSDERFQRYFNGIMTAFLAGPIVGILT